MYPGRPTSLHSVRRACACVIVYSLQRAGADLVFAAVSPFVNAYGGWSPSLQLALEGVKMCYSLSERHRVRLVERRGDLAYPGLKSLLVLEGADVLNSVDDLRLMYRLGVRGVGVTWNLNNRWGRPCYRKGGGGLTEEGYALVEAAQRLGMVVVLAHAGRKTALDVLEAARRPVVISHANVNDVYSHPRNVDGEVIKRLVDNGGVLGLTFMPRTISDSPTAGALVKHAKYVKERYGVGRWPWGQTTSASRRRRPASSLWTR